MLIITYDKVYGYVNYGDLDLNKNGGYATKRRCKKCGNAWIAENFVSGYDTCPECGVCDMKGTIFSPQ